MMIKTRGRIGLEQPDLDPKRPQGCRDRQEATGRQRRLGQINGSAIKHMEQV